MIRLNYLWTLDQNANFSWTLCLVASCALRAPGQQVVRATQIVLRRRRIRPGRGGKQNLSLEDAMVDFLRGEGTVQGRQIGVELGGLLEKAGGDQLGRI